VYVGSDDYLIYFINATNGAFIRAFFTGGIARSSPAVADDKVYFGSYSGVLYTFSANGSGDWSSYILDGPISSSPAVQNFRLFIGTENGGLYCFRDHNPPLVPEKPDGPLEGVAGKKYSFVTETSDPEGDQIYYMFDWGEGNQSEWVGPLGQHQDAEANYTWATDGYYNITVKAKDSFGYESDWSEPFTIHIKSLEINYIRGGLGLFAAIKNVGQRKIWRVKWNISIVGGLVQSESSRFTDGEILTINPSEYELISTGPFFELGRIKITISIVDNHGENTIEKSFIGYSFGLVLILSQNR
jgi:hypothetical protein